MASLGIPATITLSVTVWIEHPTDKLLATNAAEKLLNTTPMLELLANPQVDIDDSSFEIWDSEED